MDNFLNQNGGSTRVTRVTLCDDEPLVLQALQEQFKSSGGFEVVGTSKSPHEAWLQVRELRPDLVIHELSYAPGGCGIELVNEVKALKFQTECIAFTRCAAAMFLEHFLRSGGRGYVMKTEPTARLIEAARSVTSGNVFVSERQAGQLLGRIAGGRNVEPLERLSTGEFQVLHLIAQGMSSRQIADSLHRSSKTIETYRSRIKQKLGLQSGVELAQFAARYLGPAGGDSLGQRRIHPLRESPDAAAAESNGDTLTRSGNSTIG